MKHLVLALGLVALPVKQKQESLLSPIQPLTPYIQTTDEIKTLKINKPNENISDNS